MPSASYHVFSLPPELVANVIPRNHISDDRPKSPEIQTHTPTVEQGVRACNVCLGATFGDVDDQRAHFRSDWHRYNVKARLANGKAVDEAEFGHLVEELDDSLSGSASSSDEEDSSDDPDAVQTLLSKTKLQSRSQSPDAETSAPNSAVTWFHSPPDTQLGIYRALFDTPSSPLPFVQELKSMQHVKPEGRRWAMFMVAGGHFAGMLVRVSRTDEPDELPKKGKQKVPKPEMEILRHKTFHRYTTRRKQGGAQSANDNAKGNAKSAGAQLRRYGEQALRDDIRGLLEDWSEDLATCERIWLRASGSNKRIFWDYDGSHISKGDDRLRTFPFPTRRPTQSELSRCLMELTQVKITRYSEEELRAQHEAYQASLPKPRPKPVVPTPVVKGIEKKAPKLSKEEEVLRDKWDRLLDMIKRGRLDVLKAFWEREGSSMGDINIAIPAWTNERGGTLLQVAAMSGQEEVTSWLLVDLRADPTISVPGRSNATGTDEDPADGSDVGQTASISASTTHRAAYDLASDRAVRDVFRRAAAAHPDWWDWLGAGRVPSLLSKEMEEDRENKKKVRRKGLKEKIKDREARNPRDNSPDVVEVPRVPEPVKESTNPAGARKLGGASGGSEGLAGLTPEMRARIERERRARAAETRLGGRR